MSSDSTPFQTRTKLLSLYAEHVRDVGLGKDPYPVAMEVNLSNNCNQGCHWCISENAQSKANLDIEHPSVAAFFRDFKTFGGRAVTWSGGGEPTLHPRFEHATKLIADLGLDQGLMTHGAFSHRLVRPIAQRCSWVRISLDTHEPDAYAAKRKASRAAFERVIRNAASLVEHGARVGLNMNVARWNADHIQGVYALASSMKADYLQIRPTLPTPFEPKRHEDLLGADDSRRILEEAKAIGASASPTRLVVSTDKFDDLGRSDSGRQYRGCRSHRLFVVLDWSGELMVCMYHLRDRRFSLGNVYSQTLPQIWASPKRAEVLDFCENRLDHSKDGCQICCKGHEINKVLFGSVEGDPPAKTVGMTPFL